jgi:hypothetical protein
LETFVWLEQAYASGTVATLKRPRRQPTNPFRASSK